MLLHANVQDRQEVNAIQPQSIDFVCSICDCRYTNEKQFYGHLHVHNGDVQWKCTQCPDEDIKFQSQSKLKLHENSHHNVVRPFRCEKCDLAFDRASQLDYHRRSIHQGEKSQLCEICGKGFFRKTDLRTHLNIHLGTNLCICEICGRKFNHISNLIRHCRMHAGVKPYPCSICGKRFTQISSLARHKHIHERSKESVGQQSQSNSVNNKTQDNHKNRKVLKRQHYCKICGESFNFVFLLRQHEKSHLESAVLECKNCGKSFKKPMELKEHRCAIEHTHESEDAQQNTVQPMDVLKDINNSQEVEQPQEPAEGIPNSDEPMLRLVQTETGEQFYEFIISNLVEKLPIIQPSKTPEKLEEASSISQSTKNDCTHAKDLQDIADMHDMSFAPLHHNENEHLFCPSPKSKESLISVSEKDTIAAESSNPILLSNDPQGDFDRYVEANFEVFERLNYENSSERFLEFVGIAENGPETLHKESSMVCFVQNEGEQFFELLQDSQIVSKSQNDEFIGMDQEEHEKSLSIDREDDRVLLDDIKNATEFQEGQKKNQTLKKAGKQTRSKGGSKEKKSKLFLIKFQCTVCDKSFSTSYNYKQHIGTHFADQQKFHCKECGMSFAWKSTLNKHVANNHRSDGPQKFVCEICPKVYSTLSQVNEHVKRDHLKQRNHTCSQCGKSFFKKYDLKIHNRIHTDERPYVCRACGKRFHHRSHIIRHERIHF